MINVNIVYDDIYDDVDIIAIPDELENKIEEIVMKFTSWIPPADDEDYWVYTDGKRCMSIETEGFLKWLNGNYCKTYSKAYIVKQHTDYCPQFKSIEF